MMLVYAKAETTSCASMMHKETLANKWHCLQDGLPNQQVGISSFWVGSHTIYP